MNNRYLGFHGDDGCGANTGKSSDYTLQLGKREVTLHEIGTKYR